MSDKSFFDLHLSQNHKQKQNQKVMKEVFEQIAENFKTVNKSLAAVDLLLQLYRREIGELRQRVKILEQKAGISSEVEKTAINNNK